MIAPVEQPWTKPVKSTVCAPKTAFLKETVYRLDTGLMACQPEVPSARVMEALRQLVDIVLQLRSPTGGWPAALKQTPENLVTYVGEEIGELLDSLDQEEPNTTADAEENSTVVVPMAELIPHVLWLLASSNYEVMRLLEGVRSRVYTTNTHFSLGVVRLVPVLSLQGGESDYGLDLVTQAEPDEALFVSESSTIKLVENDLDDQPMAVATMLASLKQEISQTKPQLSQLLGAGWSTAALSPFQPWQRGVLNLRLYLADMGERQSSSAPASTGPPAHGQASQPSFESSDPTPTAASGFTLDDFAGVLEDAPQENASGILGDWLTFTDEAWVQDFLNGCACEIMLQHLPKLFPNSVHGAEARELLCIELAYAATTLVQGDQALSKHTFVHEPALVADIWLRLRWYLAHCSERVMQLMGGLFCRLLLPGRGWQQGYLYLKPVMTLTGPRGNVSETMESWSWMLDLANGRLLPTHPLTLPAEAVVDLVGNQAWQSPLAIGELAQMIDRDITHYAAAIAALGTRGTTINLHRLESEEGLQSGYLKLNWGFTLQPNL